jgi:hypothetical protein
VELKIKNKRRRVGKMSIAPRPLPNPERICAFNTLAQVLRALAAAHPPLMSALQAAASTNQLAFALLHRPEEFARLFKELSPQFRPSRHYCLDELYCELFKHLPQLDSAVRGTFTVTEACTRGHGYVHEEARQGHFFRRLVVPLPAEEQQPNLQAAVERYFAPEHLPDAVCPFCHARIGLNRQASLRCSPDLLVVDLARFKRHGD